MLTTRLIGLATHFVAGSNRRSNLGRSLRPSTPLDSDAFRRTARIRYRNHLCRHRARYVLTLSLHRALTGETGGTAFPLLLGALLEKVGFGWTIRIWALITLFAYSGSVYLLEPRIPPVKKIRREDRGKFLPVSWAFLSEPVVIFMVSRMCVGGDGTDGEDLTEFDGFRLLVGVFPDLNLHCYLCVGLIARIAHRTSIPTLVRGG